MLEAKVTLLSIHSQPTCMMLENRLVGVKLQTLIILQQ